MPIIIFISTGSWGIFKSFLLILYLSIYRKREGDAQVKLKSESDIKRDRKRNLVPAKTGIYILILMVVYTIISCILYISFSDIGTRAYIMSLAFDILSCIIVPGLIVFQAPSIRRKMNKTLSRLNNGINISEVRESHTSKSRKRKGLVW